MKSFFRVKTIVGKEFSEFLWSPMFFILTGVFSLIIGFLFYNYLILSKEITNLSVSYSVLRPIYGNMNLLLLFIVPLLTMNSFSEEISKKTIDLLFMSRVKDYELILGKIIATFLIVFLMISSSLIFPIILAFAGFTDWGVVLTSFLGILFCSLCYISVGVFASTLTKNNIVAAFVSIGILLSIVMLVFTANTSVNPLIQQMGLYLAPAYHFEFLSRGTLNNFGIVYFISFFLFFFSLTKFSLERRAC